MSEKLIGFEGLGIAPFSVDRVAFRIGNFEIYWYAIIITVGMLLAVAFALRQARSFGLEPDHILDIVIFGLPAAIICARAYYVIFSGKSYASFKDLINIREGGLAIYGAIIGAFLTGLIYCRVKKINMLALYDVGAFGFLIGQAVGRWGNFVNAEAFGEVTSLPWGMTINGNGPYHPTFFYESLWNVIGFALLFLFAKKWKKRHGEIFFLYFAWYGLGRAWIEGLRTDSLMWGSFRVSQILAMIFFVCGAVGFLLSRKGVWDRVENKFTQKAEQKKAAYRPVYLPLLEQDGAKALNGGETEAALTDGTDPEASEKTAEPTAQEDERHE